MDDDAALMADEHPPADAGGQWQLNPVLIPHVTEHRQMKTSGEVLERPPQDSLAGLGLNPFTEPVNRDGPETRQRPVQVVGPPVFPKLENEPSKLRWKDADDKPGAPAVGHCQRRSGLYW